MNAIAKNRIFDSSLPDHLGRFQPIGVLGKGAQGIVYLAEDSELGRQVAIKTLDKHHQNPEHLKQEALNVSQLSHQNIVPLYEIGFEQDLPFLVYHYYQGEQLKQKLQRETALKQYDAVRIIDQILAGVGYAHNNQIIHRDLNPSNVMLDEDGKVYVMDFGISVLVGSVTASTEVTGTVNYLAPEQLNNSELTPAVDIFACGLILYEMLTGHQVYQANNAMAVMFKISNEEIVPPSKRNPEIDNNLDAICLKALNKDPEKRFATSEEMQAALKQYIKEDLGNEVTSENNTASAVSFLLRRMKRKQDFPAISSNITDINQKTSGSNKSSANELSNVILKDYALTTKLLRLVNSSFYGQFGGEITTVSRAVVILGYEQVRAAVLSIILFEHLQNTEQANDMKNAAYTALMSGIIAREQAKSIMNIDEQDTETCFVTSMFYKLGKLLTIYYFPEDYEAVNNMVVSKGIDESQAMRSVLGVSYHDLGRGIAREWKLPAIIVDSMSPLPEETLPKAKNSDEQIKQLTAFSNELCEINHDGQADEARYEEFINRYQDALGINKDKIQNLLESSITEAEEFTRILNIDTSKVTVFNELRKVDETKTQEDKWDTEVKQKQDEVDIGQTEIEVALDNKKQSQQDILVNGISEITNAMLEEYSINDILTMVLETIYRGMGFNRVLFAIHDPKSKQVSARFGFGNQFDEIMPRFRYTIDQSDDVMVSTVRKGKEYIILDVNSDEYKNRVPVWLRELATPTLLVLYPLVVNKRCLGLIYADHEDSNIKISMEALGFFKTLRNQASLAIQQKSK
ncbi:MAG: protein kinase [Pseudomonadota bacterium]